MRTFGSLFAGIGGIDLGLERAGWSGRWQVEYEPYCQRVLAHHWPDVQRYGDIHDVDFRAIEPVDLIAGGFPCQPISSAGRQRAQEDERWLWPHFLRAIRDVRPKYALLENVANLLGINGGTGLGDILGDLATLGYDAEWDCVPAAAVGAPHIRDRFWLVAYTDGLGQGWSSPLGSPGFTGLRQDQAGAQPHGAGAGTVADTDGTSAQGSRVPSRVHPEYADPDSRGSDTGWVLADAGSGGRPGQGQPVAAIDPAPAAAWQATQPVDGGGPHQWSVEPDVGRVAHGVPQRVDRLRALGNAVVPQVVEFIGRRILEADSR
jgi:DNA (cytosine-5)-methyltransferase 1